MNGVAGFVTPFFLISYKSNKIILEKTSSIFSNHEVIGGKSLRNDIVFPQAAYNKNLYPSFDETSVQSPLVDKKYLQLPEPWSRWGNNNLQPDVLMQYVKKCGLLARAISTLASYTTGNGVFFYTIENGLMKEADPKWMKMWIAAHGPRWLYKSTIDYWTFGLPFTKFVMSSEGQPKPLFIISESTPFCRWEKQDKISRSILNCYVSNQWDTAMGVKTVAERDEYIDIIPALDPFFAQLQLKEAKAKSWMIGIDNYTPGNYYYPTLPWHSSDVLKYIDILSTLPSIEQSHYENSLSATKMILIDEDYLAKRLGYKSKKDNEYLTCAPEKVQAMRNQIRDEFDTNLKGSSSEKKTIVTQVVYDENGNKRPALEVVDIKNSNLTSDNIPNSQNASGKLLESFGVDPAMLGSVMSDTKSRGGGSDKEAAMIALQNWLRPDRENLLFPARIFMQAIGMPDDMMIGIRDFQSVADVPMQNGRQWATIQPTK